MAKNKPKMSQKASLKYAYLCPACSDVAIESSNKMIGPMVDCMTCGKLIKLDDIKRYKKINS